MDTNLLSNRELENYQVEDSFNFLVKADAIKIFLEHNSTKLEKNKMLVLYGDWGSGKTSLMKHIESEISKDIYYPIFFHAWEHEKDENLALSLCDALTSSIEGNDQVIKDFMKGAFLALKSFASGITLKAPGYLTGLGMDLEVSGEKIVKNIDEVLKRPESLSFYASNQSFKDKFKEIESLILKKANAQKILIFVDDLDRCEPENVLNLITALKLFFTYGDKTVYFCGIDKEAITKAVKTKYKDVVKSEEYMEKVFDIAFNMPKTYSLKKMLEPYFFNIEIKSPNGYTYSSTSLIEEFIHSIGFTNPRHLKKILNKFEIIKSFKSLTTISKEIRDLIPDIIVDNQNGKIFETIYCLFFIILYEFKLDEFNDIENYDLKMTKYADILHSENIKRVITSNKSSAKNEINNSFIISSVENKTFGEIYYPDGRDNYTYAFSKFLFIFSNSSPNTIHPIRNDQLYSYNELFSDNELSTKFCKFLIIYNLEILTETKDSNYIIWNLFNMVKYLL